MISKYQKFLQLNDGIGEGFLTCKSLGLVDTPCEIKKENHYFSINLSMDGCFDLDGKEYTFELLYLEKKYSFQSFISSGQIVIQERISTHISIRMYRFEEDLFPTSSFYQMLIPCEKPLFTSRLFENFIPSINVDGVEYSIKDSSMLGQSFLEIKNLNVEQYEIFWKKAYCICSALGFLIGKYYQRERYVFALSQDGKVLNFLYESGVANKKLTPILCLYPYFPNEGGHSHDVECSLITDDFFAVVVKKLFENERYLNAVLLVLESSDIPLESQIVCLYAALEGITGIVEKQITQKSGVLLTQAQISQIKALVNGWKESDICAVNKRITLKKIDGLSQLPNSIKLEAPFEYLGLLLSKEEECILHD